MLMAQGEGWRRALFVGLMVQAALLGAGTARADGSLPAVTADPARCASLMKTQVPARAFALPTGGATISEAVLVAAQPGSASVEYCRVRGAIAAVQSADPPILFQINLPTQWNAKTVQFGGGGLNGVVVEATGAFKGGGGAVPTALERGFVTYGSDSGHEGATAEFLSNAQAFANYSHEAVKRSKDAMTFIAQVYYGQGPRRNYHIGGSKGGQEGLQAVQRYARDFDGVVSYYPAAQNQSLTLGWNRLWRYAFDPPGGALDEAGQRFLKERVLAACDDLDGARDGLVSNVEACTKTFKVDSLLCREGQTGQCLTKRQITALQVAARPFTFAYPMPNGVTEIGPWPVLLGGDIKLWFGTGVDGSQQMFYRAAKARPEALGTEGVTADMWRRNVLAIADIYDATSTDLDTFKGRGGKLIIVQGVTDMLVPVSMTNRYVETLKARYGAEALAGFVRYYVAPGYGHGSGAFNVQWDSLAALDAWVERQTPPSHVVVTDGNPENGGRQRPLCEYPTFPRYRGTGDVNAADSFACARE